jgi:hypothetical protein
MNAQRKMLGLVVAVLLTSGAAHADVIRIVSSRDATIYQNDPDNSNGAGFTLFAGTKGTGSPRRALLAFDVAGNIPALSTINSVQLTLVLQGVAGQGGGEADTTPRTISLHRLLADWGEGTTGMGSGGSGTGEGFPAHPGDATWLQNFFGLSAWANAGGDFAAAASGSAVVSQTLDSPYTWNSTAQLVSDVQSWLDTPASNFGWLLLGEESSNQTFRQFYTREAANPAFRPALLIDYTPPSAAPVPEPFSLALGGIGTAVGLLGCLRRRAAPLRPEMCQ